MIKKISPKIERGVELLKGFGLTENDALIYAYLLERGVETGGLRIAQGIGIHRQYVYPCIVKLAKLGLIELVKHGKQNKYKATPPNQINKIAKKRVFEAENIVEELNTFSNVGSEQDFEIFVGDVQVREYELSLMNSLKMDESQFVISGASQNFLDYFGEEYEKLALKGRNKKLKTFYIGGKHEMEYLAQAKKINPHFTYRLLDDMPQGATSTVVRHNSIVLYSLAKPPLIYVIHSEVIAKEYKAYFDMLWNLAKP
ncbi:MAG: helix-turn-helix domain-containing protein [Candidatus Moraniibacteriota bacterium]